MRSFTPGIAIPFTGNATGGFGVSLQGKVYLKPGTVTSVAVDKKSFKGNSTRVTITGSADQDRSVCRPVLHSLVRDINELDRQHRRRHHLSRRHQGCLTAVQLERKKHMLNRFVMYCLLPADRSRERAARRWPIRHQRRMPRGCRAAADNGVVASAEPGVVTTPDGLDARRSIASNETQLPVARPDDRGVVARVPRRRHLHRNGLRASGSTSLSGGTLEAGYQIGCGIELGQVRLIGSVGRKHSGFLAHRRYRARRASAFLISGTIEIHAKPGNGLERRRRQEVVQGGTGARERSKTPTSRWTAVSVSRS